jgi:hypothetical protein
MWRSLVLVGVVGLSGCTGREQEKGTDLGPPTDAGPASEAAAPAQCGAHVVFLGDCAARCPGPCACVDLFHDDLPAFQLCGVPCQLPGSCPEGERCAFTESGGGPVCMPAAIKPPPAPAPSVMVDCFTTASFIQPSCRDGFIVQWQSFGVKSGGEFSGSFCAKVLLEACVGACATSDAGTASCPGGYVDAGPTGDAGVACCLTSSGPGGATCRALGGVKQPPHGCAMVCCEESLCTWVEGKDSFGCTTWTLAPQDGGVAP